MSEVPLYAGHDPVTFRMGTSFGTLRGPVSCERGTPVWRADSYERGTPVWRADSYERGTPVWPQAQRRGWKACEAFSISLGRGEHPNPGTIRRTVGFYGGAVSYERVSPVLNPHLLSTEAAPPFFSLIRTLSAWSGQVEESFYEYPTIFNIVWAFMSIQKFSTFYATQWTSRVSLLRSFEGYMTKLAPHSQVYPGLSVKGGARCVHQCIARAAQNI